MLGSTRPVIGPVSVAEKEYLAMTMTSGLTIDLEGELTDISLGTNGDITRLEGGGYAVIAEAAGLGISVLRIFDAGGVAVISIGFEGTAPAITGLAGGGIAVAVIDGDGNIVTQVVSGDFQTVTNLSLTDAGPEYVTVSLSATASGTFVMVTQDDFGTDNDISLHLAASDGSISSTLVVETGSDTDSLDPDVAVLANGGIVVTRTERDLATGATIVVFSTYDDEGNEVVPRTVIPNSVTFDEDSGGRVVATADGFAIVYETRFLSSLDRDIRLRTFDFNGQQTGDQFITNRDFFISGNDDGFDDTSPEIAIGPDGNIAITWTRSDGLNTDQMMVVLGQNSEQTVGFGNSENPQGQPLVTFFGTGQIAVYHVDGTQNAMVGEQFSGFRDSFGDRSNDVFVGDDFTDLINGLGGSDKLSGRGGNDTIQGGDGSDRLFGGTGDDLLQGEEGVGTSKRGDHGDRMFGDSGSDKLEGENGNDRLFGGTQNDSLFGGLDDDFLKGDAGDDFLSGDAGADTLEGGGGADTLDGGVGKDTLTGGGAIDRFKISVATTGNGDVFTDFVSGTDDIVLDFNTFFIIGSQVDANKLRFGKAAQDADDFLIYDAAKGRLLFDADADGAGAAVVIATIGVGNILVATDFEIS